MVARLGVMLERGDIVWVDFPRRGGHAQTGRRPALVLTTKTFNDRTSLMLCCPITSQSKGYPLEVPIAIGKIRGAVLADQAYTFDWRARGMKAVAQAPGAIVSRVGELVSILAQGV